LSVRRDDPQRLHDELNDELLIPAAAAYKRYQGGSLGTHIGDVVG